MPLITHKYPDCLVFFVATRFLDFPTSYGRLAATEKGEKWKTGISLRPNQSWNRPLKHRDRERAAAPWRRW